LKDHDEAIVLLGKLRQLVKIAAIGEAEIPAALASGFKDFEDAIQHFAAKTEGGVSTIITRNTGDFTASEIVVQWPDEYLARIGTPGQKE